MHFAGVELAVKNVVEETDKETGLDLEGPGILVNGPRVAQGVEESHPDGSGDQDKKKLGKQSQAESRQLVVRPAEEQGHATAEVHGQEENVSFLHGAAVHDGPVGEDHESEPKRGVSASLSGYQVNPGQIDQRRIAEAEERGMRIAVGKETNERSRKRYEHGRRQMPRQLEDAEPEGCPEEELGE